MAPFLRSMNKYRNSRFPLGHRPRNPIEELEMLGQLSDVREEKYGDENGDTSDEENSGNGEGTENRNVAAYVAPLPGVNSGVIIPNNFVPTTSALDNGGKANGVPVMLTDTNVFDCCVCFDTLTIPVYQCINGHVLCFPCCAKIRQKCPLCTSFMGSRCRGMEAVLETMKTACSNAKFGCDMKMMYNEKREHEMTCTFVPCSCPMPKCDWSSISNQLGNHLRNDHSFNIVPFQYGEFFKVVLKYDKRFRVLQASSDGKVFVINSIMGGDGNFVFLCHVGPLIQPIHYEVKAKLDGAVLMPQTSVESTDKEGALGFPAAPTRSFYIPDELFYPYGVAELQFKITMSGATPSGEGPSGARGN